MDLKKLITTVGLIVALAGGTLLQKACYPSVLPYPRENGTIEVLFSQTDNCSDRLEDLLSNAQGIKTALYDLDYEKVIDLLNQKSADLLIDEDNYFGMGQEIKGSGLMHNKFWIFYDINRTDYIATGSLNPTKRGFLMNDNNLVIISSKYLKANYEDEFNELQSKGKDLPTIYQKIIFNNNLLENYFCPDDNCEEKVLVTLKKARNSIYFMDFSFTSDPIGDYLISEKDKLDIKGVFEEQQAKSQKSYTEYYKMLDNNMNVRFDGNKYNMHHKVFIIDNQTVITGSYNPTKGGNERNDENILIIHDKRIAKEFLKEFERVWELAKTNYLN